jgi:hypothetical protein
MKGLHLKYISVSDIHFGHEKTPTIHIVNSFIKHILTEANKTLDVIFLAGDVFDRLLDFNSKEARTILNLFSRVFEYCYTNNIDLEILEGTPSHDWWQSQTLVELNDLRGDRKCKLRYHKVLDICYIEKIGKYVLYIPDEWTNSHDDMEIQIKEKMNALGITKVDIAILHGQFAYQFAGRPYHGFHYNEEYFLKIVTGFIHVGHYHVYNPMDRILPNGSFERLAHGEEDPKGYILVNDKVYTFIENTSSYIYKTINVTDKTTVEKLDKQILKYPKDSHIRLSMSKDHPFNLTFGELKIRYIDYNVKKLIKEHVTGISSITHIVTDSSLGSNDKFILEGDIHKTLLENILSKHSLDTVEQNKLINYISIYKEAESHELSSI